MRKTLVLLVLLFAPALASFSSLAGVVVRDGERLSAADPAWKPMVQLAHLAALHWAGTPCATVDVHRFSGDPERRAAELKASMYNLFWTLEDLGQPLPDLEVWLAQRAHIRLLVVLSRNPGGESHVAFCLL